ncbi:MAG: NAD(P)-dependent oxidoreductase [Bacteroidales bacterium]|nr:NAD(P)-dependent oxidoreductase [Bacteroidales bacterium]
MKTGFIGLGIMGSRMATNLIKADYTVNLYNRTKSKAEKISSKRGIVKDSPAEVAYDSDVIFTMLSTPEAVQEVVLAEEGLMAGMSKGKVWIDCSTVNPSFTKQMADLTAELGFNFLDAPVAGSLVPAEKGELVFLVGGKKTIVKYCAPLFKIMGSRFVHAGDAGMGSSLKLVNNLVMGLSFYAFTEGLLLGESLGISQQQIFDLMDGSPVAAQMINLKRQKMEQSSYEPEFPLQWLQKDLHLATQTAYEQGISLPGTNTVKEIFALAKQAGLAEKDFSVIYDFLGKMKK